MDVEVRELEARKVMFVREVLPKEKLGDAFGRDLPKVFAYAGEQMAGAPFGRYPEYANDPITVEIGIPVREHLPASDDIEPGEIPGGRHAVTVHRGSYEGLPATYNALYQWLEANGHKEAGPPFESYIDDPGSTPEADLRTEICVPIA